MSFEVVYTSSPRGLLDNARGFCTVAATTGIPTPLLQKLESLSGYKHLYPPPSNRNPVNHSHSIVRLQRKQYHVLSRIADAGLDFSGRTNKIAHHVALTDAEVARMNSGPAELLADTNFWVTSWDGECEMLATGRLPGSTRKSPRPYATWTRVFGDAGWAGMLADAAVRSGQKAHGSVSVVIPRGADALGLLRESMLLVPPESQWDFSFSTYFCRSGGGTDCRIRFLIADTEDAVAIQSRRPANLIDPTGSRSEPDAANPFVLAARNGKATVFRKPSRTAPTPPSATPPSAEPPSAGPRPVTKSQLKRRQAAARAREARLAPSSAAFDWHTDVEEPDLTLAPKRRRYRLTFGILIGVGCIFLIGVAFLLMQWLS